MRVFFFGLLCCQSMFGALDSRLLSMAPPSTTVITGINVRRAAGSRSGTEMLQQLVQDPGVAKIASACGLNLRRDATELLSIDLANPGRSDSPHALLARGDFIPSRLMRAAEASGIVTRNFQGVRVLVPRTGGSAALAFLQPGVLVIGDLASVYAVVGHRSRTQSIDPILRQEVNSVAPVTDVWYATILSGAFLTQQVGDSLPSQLRNSDALASITRSFGGLQFGSTDNLQLFLVGRTAGDARSMSYVLRIAGGLARLQFGGNPGFVLAEAVLRSMQVGLEDSTVRVTSDVSDSQIADALAAGK